MHDNMSAQVILVSPNFAPLFSYVVRQLTFHKGQASTLIKSRSILGCTSQLDILICSFVCSVVHFNIDLISTRSRAVTMLCFGQLVVHHWTMFCYIKMQINNMTIQVFIFGQRNNLIRYLLWEQTPAVLFIPTLTYSFVMNFDSTISSLICCTLLFICKRQLRFCGMDAL